MEERTNVSKSEIRVALNALGIEKDSILLVHSSLKSLGIIEDGAEGVISELEKTVPDGTLVFPTLSQRNWGTVFEDWHLDRPSDVGLISETFRKQPGSLRSDNATHSVAARGKYARDIVSGPANEGERYGLFGDYCFGHYSPWQKMYDSRKNYGVKAYVMFWGVNMRSNTFKHFIEYRYVEELLENIKDIQKRAYIKSLVSHYPYTATVMDELVWPAYSSSLFQNVLLDEGIAKKIKVGDGEIIVTDIFDMVNRTEKALRDDTENMTHALAYDWVKKALDAAKNT